MQTKAMSTGFSLASCCASVICRARTGTRELRHVHRMRDAQPMLAHMLDVLGPRVDERHILARLRHVGAGITPDRARPDDGYLPGHASHPLILLTQRNPAGAAITTGRTPAARPPS